MGRFVCPFVFWSQTREKIFLNVDLKDSDDPCIELSSDKLCFHCDGVGSNGRQTYSFQLEFLHDVVSESLKSKRTDSRIYVQVDKKHSQSWMHVTKVKKKLHWLKVDFDKWKSETDEEAEDSNIMSNYPSLYEKLLRNEEESKISKKVKCFRQIYLLMYNLWQLIGFSVILTRLLMEYSEQGEHALTLGYEVAGQNIKFAQALQVLEIVHPLFKLTPGGFFSPLVQVLGRNMMLFIVLEFEPGLHSKPAVFYLFAVWSLAEIIRAPYYITKLVGVDVALLTWLRYSAWIILYPFGFLCEGVLYLRAIPYYKESGALSFHILWPMQIFIDFSVVIHLFLVLLFLPGIFLVTHHMFKQRKKVLSDPFRNAKIFRRKKS